MNKGIERFVTFLVAGFVVTATVPSFAIASEGPRMGMTGAGSVPEASVVQSNDTTRDVTLAARESAEEITECTTIDSPGRYVLAEDINRSVPPDEQGTCIEITAGNVVFDGSGGEIKGRIDFDAYGGWRVIGGTAIRAENVTNVTIRDVRLRTWKAGVRFRNVSDGDIQIRGYDHAGVDVVDSERIVFHDSVLRTAGTNFEADDVVVRRNDIDMDSEDTADIQTVRDGVRIAGEDGEIVNNTVDTVPQIEPPTPTGIVIEGNGSRIRGNLVVGKYPTRRDPNPGEGVGFSIQGDNNTFADNVVPWTGYPSEIQGKDNTFANNRVNNTGVDVSGRNNEVADSVVDGENSQLRLSGSGSTVSGSRIDLLFLERNVSAVQNSVLEIYSRGQRITIAGNTVRNRIRLNEVTNGTLRNNSIAFSVHLERASNNTLQNNTADRVTLVDSRNNSLREFTAGTILLTSLSDHNTVTGSSADQIRIGDDSRNNTIRDNDASIHIDGATSFDNRIVGNNATGSDIGIELDRSRRTLVQNNTVRNNDRGIVLASANDNRLVNNTAVDNDGPAYVSRSDATNNTVTNLTVGPTVSFRSRDIVLDGEPSPPEPPSGRADVGVFLDARNTSDDSWLNLTVRYPEPAVEDVEEETLRLWRHDRSWSEVPGFNRVDTAENVVSGNVSGDSFGVLAPLGNVTDTTPPTISEYEVRTTDADDALVVEFDSSERLSEIHTVLTNASGDEVARLNESDFTESGDSPYTYTGTVGLPNGTYTATLETATDDAGNDGANSQSDTATIGRAVVQLSLTANRTTVDPGDAISFTVTRADTGDRVNATIVADGRSVVTGADGRANVSFPDPGTFDVTAVKADTPTETFRNDTVEVTVRSPAIDRARIVVDPTNETVSTDESFRVAVTYDAIAADEVYGVQFTLEYDTSRLNATNVTKGPYLGAEGDTLVLDRSVDDDTGSVGYGESRRTEGGVSGTGTLAYVEFTAAAQLDAEEVRTNISITEVKASAPDGQRIETARRNGSVRIVRDQPPELSATLSSTVNNVGSPVEVEVRATDDIEVRAVRLFAPSGVETDTLQCGTVECHGVLSDTPTTTSWNDSTERYDPVSYRVVATDDRGTSTTETVRTSVHIAGDASGDGVVDIFDAVEVGRSWTCTVDDPCYSAAGDLNNDGVVDIFDAVVIGRNWQETAGS